MAKNLSLDSPLPEKVIERQILMYLKGRNIFAWKVKTVGTFDQKLGRYRAANPLYLKGVSDIIGIYNLRLLAIEVKSKLGKVRPEQALFMQNVLANGGIAFVARSVEDVVTKLDHWGKP